jgi:hypothetical protein
VREILSYTDRNKRFETIPAEETITASWTGSPAKPEPRGPEGLLGGHQVKTPGSPLGIKTHEYKKETASIGYTGDSIRYMSQQNGTLKLLRE